MQDIIDMISEQIEGSMLKNKCPYCDKEYEFIKDEMRIIDITNISGRGANKTVYVVKATVICPHCNNLNLVMNKRRY